MQTVLIVDDEPMPRMHAEDFLQDAGFRTISAANADEAIEMLESHNDVCAIVTDIQMPGSMDGVKLARAVRDRWPPVAIIVMSGRSVDTAEQLPDRSRFFRKPVEERQLISAIREMTRCH